MVLKPAELVPACAHAVADIASHSGLPAGVLNVVFSAGRLTGEGLVDHPDVDAISFTGSQAIGHRIAQRCAKGMKKFQLEMGGKNPQVVLDDTDLAQPVELCAQSAFWSTGQRCTAAQGVQAVARNWVERAR